VGIADSKNNINWHIMPILLAFNKAHRLFSAAFLTGRALGILDIHRADVFQRLAASTVEAAKPAPRTRENSKQAVVIQMLQQPPSRRSWR
jgi:hypothetical protein